MKVYRGTGVSARNYLDADRSPADDYYLCEGNGVARRYAAGAELNVAEVGSLSGDAYEAWVGGLDPATGEPRGRLRQDDAAVRFVEVVVNGPKSWSLAAELHPEIAAAYEAAQDKAAAQIIGWLGQHATTRVGPRGAQVATPVDYLEAVTVRHYTSRAGDPHRHLHLQVNTRVHAAGAWRGLDTVAVRDMIGAVNGIGHAAVMCDPTFRAALAQFGFTLDATGEIEQLAPYVRIFSQRAAQIEANLDRLEAAWRLEHPDAEPGPHLRRSWDALAWELQRPDKVRQINGVHLHEHWLDQLTSRGYRAPERGATVPTVQVGQLDRDQAAQLVLTRLGARRSAWNSADLRGEVEQLLAGHAGALDEPVRTELAEDLTSRAVSQCVALLDRPAPEHVRALTSTAVLAVEDDLVGRLAVRGAVTGADREHLTPSLEGGRALDAGQEAAVAAITGTRALVVIEGAAGAGKTTTLAAAKEILERDRRRLVVVTPTLKAAAAAERETGAAASSAAKLAYAHGWRWDDHGAWTHHPESVTAMGDAMLRAGDVLVVDEAGMLDQDTARALLRIADQQHARVVFMGDRYQLPAVGRGGVLDHAARWSEQVIALDVLHRFTTTRTDEDGVTRTVPDRAYAELTKAMRTGTDPGAVFDQLLAAGRLVIHPNATSALDAIAREDATRRVDQTGDGRVGGVGEGAVVVSTREQVKAANAILRAARVESGLVDDTTVATSRAGERLGVGDVVATRRNDTTLDVANRDQWLVTHVHPDGALTVTHDTRRRVLPAEYVSRHVELAYASTAHGAQGSTTTTAHALVDEHSTAASTYVAMTRGRTGNTAHVVADSEANAREQWISTFSRDRADLGPAVAREAAARDAARYATGRPLPAVVIDLREAWARHADTTEKVGELQDRLAAQLEAAPRVAAARQREADARAKLDACETRLLDATAAHEAAGAGFARDARALARDMWQTYDLERQALRADARRIDLGPGRFGHGSKAIRHAQDRVDEWARRWDHTLSDWARSHPRGPILAIQNPNDSTVRAALLAHAEQQLAAERPENATLAAAATTAQAERDQARQDHDRLRMRHFRTAQPIDYLCREEDIAATRADLNTAQQELDGVQHRIDQLGDEPAVRAQPATWLSDQRELWRRDRDTKKASDAAALRAAYARHAEQERTAYRSAPSISHEPPSHGISR